MRTFGVISAWICIAALVCGVSSIDDYKLVVSIEDYLIRLLIPLMSLNMMVCTSTANSVFRFENDHKVDKSKVSALISEMKQSVIAQFVGIAVIILLMSVSSFFKKCALVFIYHTLSISVLVMYVWLIFDVALAYFRIIKDTNY